MARHPEEISPNLTRDRLALLLGLTRELAAAVAQGDLDRALSILDERRRVIQGMVWPEKDEAEVREQLESLRLLEEEVTAFCRTWREVAARRLQVLNSSRLARLSYDPPGGDARFIDVNK